MPLVNRNEFNDVLHCLRTMMLAKAGAKADTHTFLTAGASGSWYFDWIDWSYGPVGKHIAIEKYSPRPEILPENVEWIPESIGSMDSIPTDSVDVMFSGQNLEHLWVPEIVGSMMEASRVIKTGGRLIMDSPNRTITKITGWAHPEHVIEFTPREAAELAEAAGFRVEKLVGLWLCKDPETGEDLPLEAAGDWKWSYEQRIVDGMSNPDHSFIWWLEGVREREPNRQELEKIVNRVYAEAWPERLTRYRTYTGDHVVDAAGDGWYEVAPDKIGAAVFGPYAPLVAGHYSVQFSVSAAPGQELAEGFRNLTLQVFAGHHMDHVIREVKLVIDSKTPNPLIVNIDFDLDQLFFGIQFRAITDGGALPIRVGDKPVFSERELATL